jgi:hypothetical protein
MNKCIHCSREFIYIRSKGGTKNQCNTCQVNHRRFILKKKIINYLGDKCKKCNYKDCMGALVTHHTDPDKKDFNLSGAHSRSWKSIETELKKCILLCANCHSKEHHNCKKYNC